MMDWIFPLDSVCPDEDGEDGEDGEEFDTGQLLAPAFDVLVVEWDDDE